MARYCPNCKHVLNSSSNYFCVNCGFKLPKVLHASFISNRKITKVAVNPKCAKTVTKHRRTLIGFILVVISAVVIYLLVGYISSEYNAKKEVTAPNFGSNKTSMAENTNVAAAFGEFSAPEYVPYSTDFYMELNNLNEFKNLFSFLGPDYLSLVSSLEGKVYPFYVVFITKSGDDFIWSLLVFPSEGYAGISGEYENLYIDKVESSVLISKSEGMVDLVTQAKTGLSKSLSLHPKYVSIKSDRKSVV